MLIKDMASGKLVEVFKRYWFLYLVFGTRPTQSIITLLNVSSNAGMGFRGTTGTFWLNSLPFDKCDKSCKILPLYQIRDQKCLVILLYVLLMPK